MSYGIARAATSPELTLFRASGKKSRFYAAIKQPHTIYTARVNQVITDWDGLQSIIFDGGSGTPANLLPHKLMDNGTTARAGAVGFVQLRGADSNHFYFQQYSKIKILDNQYLKVVGNFR